MKKQAWIGAVMALVMAAGLGAAGCGEKSDKPKTVKIVFWEWWADQQSIFDGMAKEYEAKTGVKVQFELSAPVGADYFNKVQAAAQANTLPDIIGLAGGGEFLARYINANKIFEITNELNANGFEWRNSFFPRALDAFYYDENNAYQVRPKTFWGLPVSVMNIQIYYNKDLFQKAGLDPEKPPKTWQEFLEAGDKLNAAGIPPFIVGFGDLWIDYTFFNAYSWAYLGEQKIRDLWLGKLPYTDAGLVSTLKRVEDLRDHKILYPGSTSMANKEAEINFANQKAAMMLNGSWAVNVYKGMNPAINLGVFPFPKPTDAQFPMYIIGGVGKGCAITANSEFPEAAVAFLRWFTAKEQQVRLAKEAHEIPANFNSMEDLDPLLKGFAAGMRNLTPDLKNEEKFEVREALSKGMQSILIGEAKPEEILIQAQEAKQKTAPK
jgi:ABC-type glycerol-3-phosphate transport system substrate-binding protein